MERVVDSSQDEIVREETKPALHWWSKLPHEYFWLEATDREDVGANLRAPIADASGKENWRYALFRAAHVGDIVYHYHTAERAIIGWSRVAGLPTSRPITWAARGSYARDRHATPRELSGYVVPLDHHTLLRQRLTLEDLRNASARIREVVRSLQESQQSSLYFPFELSDRPLRLLQGYAFKLPAAFLDIFPEMLDPDPRLLRTDDEWTDAELAVCIDAYLQLAEAREAGTQPTASEMVRRLVQNLQRRSEGAIARRLQSISTVLQKSDQEWIRTFPPRENVGPGVEARLTTLLDERQPTSDDVALARLTRTARARRLRVQIAPPVHRTNVTAQITWTVRFCRSADVRAWVLIASGDTCDGCRSKAPFVTDDGTPFLEVHHLRPLAEGGPDTVDNAVALCPNCHRRLHHGHDRAKFRAEILQRILRLSDYPIRPIQLPDGQSLSAARDTSIQG